AAERLIAARLSKLHPGAVLIGEEASTRNPALLNMLVDADLAFLIDPIDGTRNYVAGLPLFGMMLVGGGVEELGWRGIAQPELARRHGPLPAALVVGLVWALWHLPLFHIPGVSQYGGSFPHFAAGVFGSALLLAGV
ncbi:CPBP family glutamic-type intramembrane protease, partial [Escherichia coli]|nr:CPBP family glutamic-type intramembrane protease [Escherichia coli]